jgi:hypothetical protein
MTRKQPTLCEDEIRGLAARALGYQMESLLAHDELERWLRTSPRTQEAAKEGWLRHLRPSESTGSTPKPTRRPRRKAA